MLRAEGAEHPEARATEAQRILEEHPDWPHDPAEERAARLQLWKLLVAPPATKGRLRDLPAGYGRAKLEPEKIKPIVDHLLRIDRLLEN